MTERHLPGVGWILKSVEGRIEQWRREVAAREAEVEANRERLWEEAMKRERLFASASREESVQSPSEAAEERRVVFVIHTAEMAKALDALAREKATLTEVVPAGGGFGASSEVDGSWLVFEAGE